jgi:hypothetical protein
MACTALYEQDVIPQYASLLEQGQGPGIRALQGVIEKAWDDGMPRYWITASNSNGGLQATTRLAQSSSSANWSIHANGLGRETSMSLSRIKESREHLIFLHRYLVTFSTRCELTDFPEPKSNPAAVINWVSEYFFPPFASGGSVNQALSGASPVVVTGKMPLILQVSHVHFK